MNASKELDTCLNSLWRANVKPYYVVVSDDSLATEIQQQNRYVVDRYSHTDYTIGPHAGVSANRNCALERLTKTDFIAFIDDDICIHPDFIETALAVYQNLTPEERDKTFLTGGKPTKLSFRGFFCPNDYPLCVDLHTAVFPAAFFATERWDEKIFFGYEDALLCLRAIKQGYRIIHCPELKITDTRFGKSTLKLDGVGKLTKYEVYVEAARLYVGIERYKNLYPNPIKLVLFLIIYFIHMNIYLLRNQALPAWKTIIHHSRLRQFF